MRRRARMIIPGTARRPCSPRSTSRVLGQCSRRHRHQEFVRFLDKIDRDTPAHLEVHLIADNYATHKHAAVRRWLERHPRFHIHASTSTSPRPRRPGSTWSSACSPISPVVVCVGKAFAVSPNSNQRSDATLTTATPLPNRSFGPKGSTPSFENTNGLSGTLFPGRDTTDST